MNPRDQAKQIVFDYNNNPKNYTDDEAEKVAFIAARMGLPFKAESKAIQKFFFDLVDNLAFGALPDEMRPTSRGETIYGETKAEKVAGLLSLAGLAVPFAAGAKLGTTAVKAGLKKLPRRTKEVIGASDRTLQATMQAGRVGGGMALMNLLEDPAGVPSRLASGALLGGALGGAGLLKSAYTLPRGFPAAGEISGGVVYAPGQVFGTRALGSPQGQALLPPHRFNLPSGGTFY
mgnify:CR=1 FL=1|jgi:hypothetical protein